MNKTMAAVSLIALATGCAHGPVQSVSVEPWEGVSFSQVREDFARVLPDRFEILESVIFRYRSLVMVMLGYSEVDTTRKAIVFAAFSSAGIKMAEARSIGDRIDYNFTLSELRSRLDTRKLAEGLIAAIRRVYFDRVPRERAEADRDGDRFYFRQHSGPGILEFVFGGAGNVLVEKNYRENGVVLWKVTYFEYRNDDRKLYPSRVVFRNHVQDYEVTLRLKEIFR